MLSPSSMKGMGTVRPQLSLEQQRHFKAQTRGRPDPDAAEMAHSASQTACQRRLLFPKLHLTFRALCIIAALWNGRR